MMEVHLVKARVAQQWLAYGPVVMACWLMPGCRPPPEPSKSQLAQLPTDEMTTQSATATPSATETLAIDKRPLSAECALTTEGGVVCFADFNKPPAQRLRLVSLECSQFCCGLDAKGASHCWGNTESESVASHKTRKGPYLRLSGYCNSMCVIRLDGTADCWGEMKSPPGKFRVVAPGCISSEGCGVRNDGTGVCWDIDGKINTPELLKGRFSQMDVGLLLRCGVREAGELVCVGADEGFFVHKPEVGTFEAIDVGMYKVCALRSDGAARCWGPDGKATVTPDIRFSSIAVGSSYACAVDEEGAVQCWGESQPESPIPEPPGDLRVPTPSKGK